MISFGFTIYKLLQAFQESGGILRRPDSPRNIGLFLIGLGTVSLVIGTIEYWATLKEMSLLHHIRIWRPTLAIALIMSAIGVILFGSIIGKLI
jgi:putative membrane protein